MSLTLVADTGADEQEDEQVVVVDAQVVEELLAEPPNLSPKMIALCVETVEAHVPTEDRRLVLEQLGLVPYTRTAWSRAR